VYPRAVVGLLLFWILVELFLDRRGRAATAALGAATLGILVVCVVAASGLRTLEAVKKSSEVIVCVATVLMAQGAIAQYRMLRRTQSRGAVSLPMHLTLYLKDFTGMIFGLYIGWSAWSIITMHGSNLVMRLPVIYQYLKAGRSR
jgi:hypothetical protein